jgi:hypothetical protein
MNVLRIIASLQFATTLALGQTAFQNKLLPNEPQALVKTLYTQVMARHPHDIPEGADWNIFAPYFSKAMLHRFDLAKACSADWDRSNPDPQLKKDMASKYEIFSGERGDEPQHFQIEKDRPGKDGSVHIYVRLTDDRKPPDRPYSWRVAVVVIRKSGHSAVGDVVYINDSDYQGTGQTKPPNKRLSGYLSAGCNGSHWAGRSLPEEPLALAQGLYAQVVARKPLNIPWGEDWKVFAPYFSSNLMHRFDVYRACMADWDNQNQNSQYILKPPGLIEYGIFSGGSEQADPHSFVVERAEAQKDGSFRIYVRLRWEEPGDVLTWRVADVLRRENGRPVLDDVVFLKDPNRADDVDTPLSKLLSNGCEDTHWVGYRY